MKGAFAAFIRALSRVAKEEMGVGAFGKCR
jgi:hypothetical protein